MEPVSVNIRFNAQIVSVQGFGTALVVAQHGAFDGIRTYNGSESVAIDFPTYQGADIRRIATAYFSQVPRPQELKIANLQNPGGAVWRNWTGQLTIPTLPSVGEKISVSVVNPTTGAVSTVERIVAMGEDLPMLLMGLTSSLDGLPFLTAIATGANITISGDSVACPGARIVVQGLRNVAFLDTEPVLPYSARLSALLGIDADWYHVLVDSTSQANIVGVAEWCEAREKQYSAVTQDTRELSASVLLTALRAAGYRRTYVWFHPSGDRIDAALSGAVLPRGWDAGTAPTWAFLSFAGVSTYTLTPTQEAYLATFNANTYTVSHNLSLSWEGRSPSGVYGDLILFVDWLSARIREAVLRLLANAPNGRILYTDAGIATVKNAVYGVLVLARTRGGFSPDEDLTVTAPRAADVPVADRENRLLGGGGVGFSGMFSGAIHKVGVNGLVQ